MLTNTVHRTLLVLATGILLSMQVLAQAPVNDDFDNATTITSLPFTDTLSTVDATTAADDPYCAGNAHSVWYAFTPSQNVSVQTNTFGSDYDTTLSVYTGTRGALTQIACNDDSGGLQSRVFFEASAGVTYYIMAASFGDSPGGNLILNLAEGTLPPPIVLGLMINPTGRVNSKTGVVTIGGTLTCSRPIQLLVYGTGKQRYGRLVLTGYFGTSIDCQSQAPWSASFSAENALFTGGQLQVSATADGFDPERGEEVSVSASKTVILQAR